MSKRPSKAQASSSRVSIGAFSGGFGQPSFSNAFGSASSPLSYISEPQDLSSITNPNLVVAFKNLSKKDSTTKAKALEDITNHVSSVSGEDLEDGLLDAWVKSFPRLSIENDRRVRQLAQSVNAQLCVACGKRILKHLPKIAGAWLAGQDDSDKAISKEVQTYIAQVFASEEKRHNLLKAYQQQILEYYRSALENETPQSLSDERTVSPDEAETKYNRVVATSLAGITRLIISLNAEDRSRFQSQYDEVTRGEKIWKFASAKDTLIRREVNKLIRACVEQQCSVDWSVVGNEFIYKALTSTQTGSAHELASTLVSLTKSHPEVWTKDYKSKKPALQRLQRFIKEGSQSSPAVYWEALPHLFEILPKEVLSDTIEDASELLKALQHGITRKEEIRGRQSDGWIAFIKIAKVVLGRLAVPGQRQVVSDQIWPRISQFVLQPAGQPAISAEVAIQALSVDAIAEVIRFKWPDLTDSILENMRKSISGNGRDSENAQKEISGQGARWAFVLGRLFSNDLYIQSKELLRQSLQKTLEESVKLLNKQDGKPKGVAAVIQAIVNNEALQKEIKDDQVMSTTLRDLALVDAPNLILSPSSAQITFIISVVDKILDTDSWKANFDAVLNTPDSETKRLALEHLVKASPSSTVSEIPAAQEFILNQADLALSGKVDWSSIGNFLSTDKAVSTGTADAIFAKTIESLTIQDKSVHALSGIQMFVEKAPEVVKSSTSKPTGSDLLPSLLFLTESPDDELAHSATILSSSLKSILSGRPMKEVIQQGLCEAKSSSPSVQTLVEFSRNILKDGPKPAEAESETILQLLPDREIWRNSLQQFLTRIPLSEIAITDRLGGAVFLIDAAKSKESALHLASTERDVDGLSIPLRMGMYTIEVVQVKNEFESAFEKIPQGEATEYLELLTLTTLLADDNLGLDQANQLWSLYSPEIDNDIQEFISKTRELTFSLVARSLVATEPNIVESSAERILQNISDDSAQSYYQARAYATIMQELTASQLWNSKKTEQMESRLRETRKTKNTFAILAIIVGASAPLAQGKYATRACNELVADLTALKFHDRPEQGLQLLVQLNALLSWEPEMANTIAKQRVVFFIQHLVAVLKDEENKVATSTSSEIYKALLVIVPLMKEIYGEHWSDILESIATFWIQQVPVISVSVALPSLYSSLKLYGAILKLKDDEDTNDDLVDAIKVSEAIMFKGLVGIMQHYQSVPDAPQLPLRLVTDVLARIVLQLPIKHLEDSTTLYPLLYSDLGHIQQAAFQILHQYVPAAQEKISFDAALENKVAEFPEELLSLVLQAPDPDQVNVTVLKENQTLPISLTGYLYSWLLIFDHFQGSSHKVQTDYVAGLKEGDYLAGLLDFSCNILGHNIGKAVDVSSFPITTYEDLDQGVPLKTTQICLTHLYFLSLKHLPSLAKSWWLSCKSRQTILSLETWTEKSISPLVIADALSAVSTWSTNQNPSNSDDDTPLTVKVSPRVREITASYEVDEQQMAMLIRLPPTYPLHNATVEGLNRVAVSEQKWRAWLINAQGVITFSNNNLIDGLVAWRKNVTGALKGHSECAICYSLVSADKQLPSKRCQTCKNLFHGSCLFRWFKSSNGSTCPLCRTQFNYG